MTALSFAKVLIHLLIAALAELELQLLVVVYLGKQIASAFCNSRFAAHREHPTNGTTLVLDTVFNRR
jgi:hypothetical protein